MSLIYVKYLVLGQIKSLYIGKCKTNMYLLFTRMDYINPHLNYFHGLPSIYKSDADTCGDNARCTCAVCTRARGKFTQRHGVIIFSCIALVTSNVAGLRRGIDANTTRENRSSATAEKGLRYRFPNRCPAIETIGLVLKHRVFNPVL